MHCALALLWLALALASPSIAEDFTLLAKPDTVAWGYYSD